MESKYEVHIQGRHSEGGHYAHLSYEAHLSVQFATHFGVIAGTVEGEDTAGRSVCRNATVVEVVKKSCDLAAGLVAEFESRGWIEPSVGETPSERYERVEKEDAEALERQKKRDEEYARKRKNEDSNAD